MSLFSCREWWEHKPSEIEECDKGCLAVGNIDNEPQANGAYRFIEVVSCCGHSAREPTTCVEKMCCVSLSR